MPRRVSSCGRERSAHRWADVGDGRVCRERGRPDVVRWLSRRQMIEARRRAGAPNTEVR